MRALRRVSHPSSVQASPAMTATATPGLGAAASSTLSVRSSTRSRVVFIAVLRKSFRLRFYEQALCQLVFAAGGETLARGFVVARQQARVMQQRQALMAHVFRCRASTTREKRREEWGMRRKT